MGVTRLPCDQHRHHGGFARASRHLHRKVEQFGVGLLVGSEDMLRDMGILTLGAGNLSEPNAGFDRLHLTEEGTSALKLVAAPVC